MIGGSEASKVISHYTWQGKQETSDEVLCIFKTRAALFEDIEKDVASKHPYDCPEIIAMPIVMGNKAYLDWIDEMTNK